MNLNIQPTESDMGQQAASDGAAILRRALAERGEANLIVATGASQFQVLEHLVQAEDIDWHRVTGFHLDEYIGIPIRHGASFRRYLWERFHRELPLPLRAFHYLDGDPPGGEVHAETARVGRILDDHPIDVAFIGIGENGHIAFNDPPADFETKQPYLEVDLDERCRQQQLGEGWFPTLEDVPRRAISMSVRRILKSRAIVCSVPDERKAEAVRHAVEGDVTPQLPASILQEHEACTLYLDEAAASQLSPRTRQRAANR